MPQISQEQYDALELFKKQRFHVMNVRDPHGERGMRLIGLRVPSDMCGGHGLSDIMFMFEKAFGIHPSQKEE